MVKNPIWRETDQWAIYKGRVSSGTLKYREQIQLSGLADSAVDNIILHNYDSERLFDSLRAEKLTHSPYVMAPKI